MPYGCSCGLRPVRDWITTERERLVYRPLKPWKLPIRAWLAVSVYFLPCQLLLRRIKKIYALYSNVKKPVPLCHVASGAMRCFDCTWRMRTRDERFSFSLQMQVPGYACQRSTVPRVFGAWRCGLTKLLATQFETRCSSGTQCCSVCLESRNYISFDKKFSNC